MADADDGFLSRWSRRKVQAGKGLPLPPEPAATPSGPSGAAEPKAAGMTAGASAAEVAPGAGAAQQAHAPEPAPGAASPADLGRPAPPPPTLDDALQLRASDTDFSRFVGRNVDPQVRHTALRTLFSDPHFNVMDGLDVYIDDYGKPDPLPAGMLRQMVQSSFLGLFDHDKNATGPAGADAPPGAGAVAGTEPAQPLPAPAPDTDADTDPSTPRPAPHEDSALRLQPHDAAGRSGDRAGPGEDPGGQH